MTELVIFGMGMAEWTLLGCSFIGALFSNLAIQGNRLLLPRFTREYIDLGAFTIGISAVVVYLVFMPHNAQTAIMSGIALEDFWVFIRGREAPRAQRPRESSSQKEYTPQVLAIEFEEIIRKLRKEYEYMKSGGDEI